MLAGGGCIHLIDSVKNNNMNFVCNLHEQASSISAESYSQYTDKFGVCLVTTAPGGTNAITGCASAWLESTPVMYISGQVNTKQLRNKNGYPRQFGFQQINIVDIVSPITKYSKTVTTPSDIPMIMEIAYMNMMCGRKGSVWLDIPLDIQSSMIDDVEYKLPSKKSIILSDYTYIVDYIYKSKKPVLLIGNGIRLANGIPQLLQLINILKIPVLTTWKMIDVINQSNPYYFGRPGIIAQKHANIIQQQADLIISIGCRLDTGQTAFSQQTFGYDCKKIIVDIDQHQLNKLHNMKNTNFINIDAKQFIVRLIENSSLHNLNHTDWLSMCKDIRQKNIIEYSNINEYKINLYKFIEQLSQCLSSDAIIVVGSSGSCSEVTFQHIKLKDGQRIINTHGLGSMGFAIPSAIGVSVASKRPIVMIQGDGSFAMNVQELQVVADLGLNIKMFIINNNGYVSIRNTQNSMFDGNFVGSECNSGLHSLNIKKQAEAYSIQYISINSINEMQTKIKMVLEKNVPILCQVVAQDTHKTYPRTIVKRNKDGSLYTMPMEELICQPN